MYFLPKMISTEVTIVKNRKHTNKSKNNTSNSYLKLIYIIPLTIGFFLFGVYFGSTFFHTKDNYNELYLPTVSIIGLPGTTNKLHKWNESIKDSNNLRKNNLINDHILVKHNSNLSLLLTDNTNTKNINFKNSLYATSRSYITAPNNLDDDDIMIATWIYLNKTNNDNDMRTIFSNKMPGCDIGIGQNGLSMYVNAWQESDQKLYIEYGSQESGCSKIDSKNVKIEYETWYHVAVYTSSSVISLFINIELVNSMVLTDATKHQKQQENSFMIGVYDHLLQWPLNGYISHLVIIHEINSMHKTIKELIEQSRYIHIKNNIVGIYAYYPFTTDKKEIEVIHNFQSKYTFPVIKSTIEGVNIRIVDGLIENRIITDEIKLESDKLARIRREYVREGMEHAWNGYKEYAWGSDELRPISNRGQDNWGGMGVTLVDSLDTLWYMGMKDEFTHAKEWVEKSLTFNRAGTVSVFETTIRELGGLLAAYDINKDMIFLDKAKELADRLLPAFDTLSGIPTSHVNLQSHRSEGGWSGSNAILSELGSLQLEFRYLAHHTKIKKYEDIVMKPLQLMYTKRPQYGLYPIKISNRDGSFADSQITFGALGDSFYEYLLKIWLQGGRKELWLREMYDKAMDGLVEKLLLTSSIDELAFVSDWNGRSNNRKMDHLVCFVPGMLALGAYTNPEGIDSIRSKRDLTIAKALMYTCYQMYHRMKSGISAEYVEFPENQDFISGRTAGFYILRPETAESLFILHKLTNEPIYRDWAYEIYVSINKKCRTKSAFGAIRNVNVMNGGGIDDRMESFFLAETLKYLYLIQDPDTKIDLMTYVFNTEAHPMSILDENHIPINSS